MSKVFIGAIKRKNGQIVAVLTADGWKPAKVAPVHKLKGKTADSLEGSDLGLDNPESENKV